VIKLNIEEYKKIHDSIISLSVDADSYGLSDEDISDEDVQKCMYIAAIYETLNDVPASRVKHIFAHKGITEDDVEEFIDKLYEE
jgi:hypothetical protein